MISKRQSRRPQLLVGVFTLLFVLHGATQSQFIIAAQTPTTTPQSAAPQNDKEQATKEKRDKSKEPTAEQIAEFVIGVYGGYPQYPSAARAVLSQVRRTGVERGKTVVTKDDGKTEEISFERKSMRGEKFDKDRVRVDQKAPTLEYSLLLKDGQVSGIINNTAFTPRKETTDEFLGEMRHGLDALLRYKENGTAVTYIGKEKIKNIDIWVLDLIDAEKNRTRYYISATKGRVLWLEYEETFNGKPAKFKRTFHDYAYAQGTLVPYRSVLYADDKQVSETRVLTVTYGVKMDDTIFQTSE